MSLFFPTTADPGDLVSARRDIPVTLTNQLTGTAGIRHGSRGLVQDRTGNRLTVAFDTGSGITEKTVHARDCRLIQRNANERRFMDWAQLKAAIRTGALVALTAPLAWYTTVYWVQTGSLDGVIEALTLAVVDSALELPGLILTQPLQTLVWLAAGALAARIAFGPRPRNHKRRSR
jgi:hypothetical protein